MRTPIILLACSALLLSAQPPEKPVVELQMMTWAEIKHAIQDEGMINVIVYNGGVEQRGPQNVVGGHNLMGEQTARAIALKLGHTLVAPVIPYSVNEAPDSLPWGTIGLTGPIFKDVNERVAEQLIKNGFKNVFLMGDHGGGQKELGEVAKELDAKYSAKGVHVYFCDRMYEKAQNDYWKWLADNHYPSYGHASIMDTSEMLYLSTRDNHDWEWVRKDLIKTAVGDPVPVRGQRRDPNAPRINNGITGDARPSTPELGKRIFDMKVDYAVDQMKEFLAGQKPGAN
ncbi:MAG TPA: creatininase family protein [Bryobacteraceae bacterium]|jgi:creatinine amidohydrolase|nr:creatininase family protein [Bryobacteraceae bacterium]